MSNNDFPEDGNRITGGCYCGNIRYESDYPPVEGAGICHCRECQRWTGSAFAPAIGFQLSGFRYTKGNPKINNTSPILERCFCPDCGSSLHVRYLLKLGDEYASDSPDHVYVMIGTLDKPEAVELGFHYGVESQLPWIHFDDNLPRVRSDEDPDLINALSSLEENNEV